MLVSRVVLMLYVSVSVSRALCDSEVAISLSMGSVVHSGWRLLQSLSDTDYIMLCSTHRMRNSGRLVGMVTSAKQRSSLIEELMSITIILITSM